MDPDKADVAVRVRMLNLNINFDRNRTLMEACEPLSEYAWFIDKVRAGSKNPGLEAAIDNALNEMPGTFAIREYLVGNRAEVKMDFLTEYNEAEVLAYIREEALEEGREELIAVYAGLKAGGREADAGRFMADASYRKRLLNSGRS